MRLGTIAFLIGILIFHQLPSIPDGQWLWLICVSVPLTLYLRPLRILSWGISGFLIAWFQASLILSSSLAAEIEGKEIFLEGVISSIPELASELGGKRSQFEFQLLRSLDSTVGRDKLPRRMRLSWYRSKEVLAVGQVWRLTVKLKRPRGFSNPGSFDYERWLFRKGIRATGYVRDRAAYEYVGMAAGYRLDRVRQSLASAIDKAVPDSAFGGVLKALVVGVRHDIPDVQWQLMTETGINHLMAISGLHIGLVAGLGFFLGQWFWRRSSWLLLRWPAAKAGAVVSLLFALLYAALAGFAIPTQRALVMLVVVMLSLLLQRQRIPSQTLALAMLVVLVWDPLAVLDAGFWLSFTAVAIILYAMSGERGFSRPWRWLGIHVVISLALLPLTFFLFQQGSLVSPVANFIAVPWVSLTVVPLSLLGALLLPLLAPAGALFLGLADLCLLLLWPLMEWLAALPWSHVVHPVPHWGLMLPAAIGVIWLCAPRGLPARWLGLLWLAPLLWWPFERPATGAFWLTLLDVGQGLSAVVETRDRGLVFDTGPRYGRRFNAGEAVVVPFLRRRGWSSLDVMVVSHGDSDHRGGAISIANALPVARVISSIPSTKLPLAFDACRAGERWQWSGVSFEMLNPSPGQRQSENNRSCVLKVTGAHGSLLLTGDIEAPAEQLLIEREGRKLAADILVVPHHGSNTSSSAAFIRAVNPKTALFPVGYGNRWNFPKARVVARYLDRGIAIHDTAREGALMVKAGAGGELLPLGYRAANRRYWQPEADQ